MHQGRPLEMVAPPKGSERPLSKALHLVTLSAAACKRLSAAPECGAQLMGHTHMLLPLPLLGVTLLRLLAAKPFAAPLPLTASWSYSTLPTWPLNNVRACKERRR